MDQLSGFIAEFEKAVVVHKDTSDVAGVRDDLIALTIEFRTLCHLEISVTGYNDDIRALYDVPEVRRWIGVILNRWPDMLFWLTPGALWVFILSMNPDMNEPLPGGGHRLTLDPEVIEAQVASSHVAAEGLLKKGGLNAAQIAPITEIARENLLAMFKRKKLGEYMVLHPKLNQVITYRRGI
ncbi:MAG: hypothetical protein HY299_02495 [Verrucomicrobia bacterium]|nr:hypothetical protein [Verrucomicrobiota bacterium]